MQKRLLSSLLKSKANTAKDIEALIDEYIASVAKSARDKSEAFLADMMVYLVQNSEIPKTQLLRIVDARLQQLAFDIPTDAIEAVYKKTAADALSAAFVFDKVDADAIEAMHRNFFWLKEDGTERMQQMVRGSIEEAFEGKIPVRELGAKLREKFGGITDDTERYFQGVSDHIIRQSQNIARVRQYEKNRVAQVKVVAVMDNRTSIICRSMNGRVIDVGHLGTQADAIQSARTVEQKKNAAIWPGGAHFGKLPKNLGLPPYHFRCRTMVAPFFGNETQVGKRKATGSYLPGQKYDGSVVVFSHIDATGRQMVVTKKMMAKFAKHSVEPEQIIAALNSLDAIGMHANEPGRFSARSGNGYYLSLEGNKIVTIFKPTRPMKQYYAENTKSGTINTEVKKCDSSKSTLTKVFSGLFGKMTAKES